MKTKVIDKKHSEVLKIERKKHKKPHRPDILFRTLLKLVSIPDLMQTHFHVTREGMEKVGKKEPCLIVMNHSSFIDLEIVSSVLYPRPFNIVATTDAFIGKETLMRLIGCIPTTKFVSDPTLVRDIIYTVKKLKSSVVIFPEAGYSFDGKATVFPDTISKLAKMLGVPLVSIHTDGAFLRDPLYNNLQRRKIRVSATERLLLSSEEIKTMSAEEIQAVISREFDFDAFKWQQENHVKIDEPTRADGLNRVLYKCPHCLTDGKTVGEGTTLTCTACGKRYTLDEYGYLSAEDGNTKFSHVPAWYEWERECVREELMAGRYSLDVPVDIFMTVDTKAFYHVGEGRLTHSVEGFHLTGCEGELDYEQKPLASYTVCSDFNFYELGDVVAIGTHEKLYYCFPKTHEDIVTKTRLATEELYKMITEGRRERICGDDVIQKLKQLSARRIREKA